MGEHETSAKGRLVLHELKQHKLWIDEESLGFLDQRQQVKMPWVENPSQSNVNNLNTVRREASKHFKNKKKACLKAKIKVLETNSNIKNIRDLYRGNSDFKKGYQPRINKVWDEKGDLFAGFHSVWLGGGTISPAIECTCGL